VAPVTPASCPPQQVAACFAFLAISLAAQAPCVDVLTSRYGVDRSGANLQETTLNIQNVNSRQEPTRDRLGMLAKFWAARLQLY
jgi:hypothetical protein